MSRAKRFIRIGSMLFALKYLTRGSAVDRGWSTNLSASMEGEAVTVEVEFDDEEHDRGFFDAGVLDEMIVTGAVDNGVSELLHDKVFFDRGVPSSKFNGDHCGTILRLEGALGWFLLEKTVV
jgi:hypothetical protein